MKAMSIVVAFLGLFICTVGWKTSRAAAPADMLYQGKTAFQWHRVAVTRRVERDHARNRAGDAIRANRRFRLRTLHRVDVQEALRLASIAYDVDYDLLYRRALCESVLDPNAKNPRSTASGLMQFLYPSTWVSTPFGRESVWSPYASALAGAWMQANHRGGEWVCQ